MRRKLVAGNWKMFQVPSQAVNLAGEIKALLQSHTNCEVLLCPPYVCLDRVKNIISGSQLQLGAQDVHWEPQGPRTGKISGDMLKDLEVLYVIVGHSEQRTYFYESDETVNKKARAALGCGLSPILCVGETLEEREGGKIEEVIVRQVRKAFQEIPLENALQCTVAYEPIWAIGTGHTASPKQAQEVHLLIRETLAKLYDKKSSQGLRIIYGGSVKADNASSLFSCEDIDGGLIGGASLKASEFAAIVKAA